MTTNFIPLRKSLREIAEAATPPEVDFVITGPGGYAWVPQAGLPDVKIERSICSGCGDEITADDETIDGMHSQCLEAGAEVGYADCDLW